VLREADWLIELGPGSGRDGGTVLASGTVADLDAVPASRIGGFLTGREHVRPRERATDVFSHGRIRLTTRALHTVHPLKLEVPRGRLTAVTGVSGSGKTTLVLESLVPALRAKAAGEALPAHVRSITPAGIVRVHLVDASPIGVNVRSTVATYSGVLDELRRAYAATPDADRLGYTAGDFSYNTGSLRCPTCEGTGQINLDVQFLPDVDIVCPQCGGHRYAPETDQVRRGGLTLPELFALTVDQALEHSEDLRKVHTRLRTLADLGLGYLTLGEATPALSGGEAQRLKLAAEVDRDQRDALFVFDEPTIGLHPLDVQTLLDVLQRLLDSGATVLVIEHDLDVIANADHVVDLGPGGGAAGGRIVATGTPEQIAAHPDSVTGRYLTPAPGRQS
jgi:excinuclease ABC subunit A